MAAYMHHALLRTQLRQQRRALSRTFRDHAAEQITQQFMNLNCFTAAQHIAGYKAFDGECDPQRLIEYAWSLKKQVYLPVLTDDLQNPLQFAPYSPQTPCKLNRFGIAEPDITASWRLAQQLDLVITPIVGFTVTGWRLGMGGGFYDRTFAFLRDRPNSCIPYLLGIAFECQKIEYLECRAWDVPLHGILTEQAFYEITPMPDIGSDSLIQ